MSDIFINYVEEDRDKAAKLASVFMAWNWTVWWVVSAPPSGAAYAGYEAKEIVSAKVVIVLWSRAACESALARQVLKHIGMAAIITVRLEEVEPPRELSYLRSFNLLDWNGSVTHEGLQNLLHHLRGIIGAAAPPAAPPASIEELSLSELVENARLAIQESAGSRPGGGTRFSGIFISYRRNDAAAYAGRLYDRLAARFGREQVFIDTENVGWGEDFVEAITAAAESCALMIVLISRGWSRGGGGQAEVDDYVRLEVATALGRKIRVIPILIQGAAMPAPKELPEDLAPLVRRNALALSDTRWERDVEDLIKSLENLL